MTPKEHLAKMIGAIARAARGNWGSTSGSLRPLAGRPKGGRGGARGVTLVEVLIVVAILAMIAGGVAIFALPKFQEAQKKTASTDAKTLQTVVEGWKGDHPDRSGECPTLETLKADKSLRNDQNVNDPWNHPYRIVCTGADTSIGSDGPDGKPGSDDDIWAGGKPAK